MVELKKLPLAESATARTIEIIKTLPSGSVFTSTTIKDIAADGGWSLDVSHISAALYRWRGKKMFRCIGHSSNNRKRLVYVMEDPSVVFKLNRRPEHVVVRPRLGGYHKHSDAPNVLIGEFGSSRINELPKQEVTVVPPVILEDTPSSILDDFLQLLVRLEKLLKKD